MRNATEEPYTRDAAELCAREMATLSDVHVQRNEVGKWTTIHIFRILTSEWSAQSLINQGMKPDWRIIVTEVESA